MLSLVHFYTSTFILIYSNQLIYFQSTVEFAKTWGRMKSNRSEEMNYEKMSRAMRYHYGCERQGRKGHLAMVKEKRLYYKWVTKLFWQCRVISFGTVAPHQTANCGFDQDNAMEIIVFVLMGKVWIFCYFLVVKLNHKLDLQSTGTKMLSVPFEQNIYFTEKTFC